MSEHSNSREAAENSTRPTGQKLPKIIFWGGSLGAVVLLGLVVLVYVLVIGDDEMPVEAPLTRTEAAISGEEARLMTSGQTSEELEEILRRLEAAANGGTDEGAAGSQAHRLDSPGEHDPFLPSPLVRRMAFWMADQYFPKGTHPRARNEGVLAVGISAADAYAAGLFGGDAVSAENQPLYHRALDYAFTVDMLEALYLMHIDTFTEAFFRALDASRRSQNNAERPLSPAEKAECVHLYAIFLEQLSGGLKAYAELPENSRRLGAWLSARERLETAKTRLIDARAEHSRLQGRGVDATESGQLLQLAERAQEQGELAEARTRENFLEALRANPATAGIDSGTLLYISCWAERRIQARKENRLALPTAADILSRLARALQAAALEAASSAEAARVEQP